MLRRLFDRVLIPPAVFDEVPFPYARRGTDLVGVHRLSDLIEVSAPAQPLRPDPDMVLEACEIEVLALAVQESCCLLIEAGIARVQAGRLATAGKSPVSQGSPGPCAKDSGAEP